MKRGVAHHETHDSWSSMPAWALGRAGSAASGSGSGAADGSPPDSPGAAAKPALRDPAAAGTARRARAPVVYAACLAAFVAAYAASLRGGSHGRDLQWMNSHLTQLGGCIAAAIGAHSAAFWAALLGAGWRHRARAAALAGLFAPLAAFVWADHGQDFAHHGMYNIMIFAVVWVPLNLTAAALVAWRRAAGGARRFWAQLAACAAAGGAGAGAALWRSRRAWHAGLLGAAMLRGGGAGAAECDFWDNLPVVDLLPQGAQNFWTGPQTCGGPPGGFAAALAPDGTLTIERCGAAAAYAPLPDTRGWPTADKTRVKAAFQRAIMGRLAWHDYAAPVRLGAEAVLVRCGGDERLLVRVARLSKAAAPPARVAAAAAFRGKPPAERPLNVLFLFLDAVSRRHFFRRLPRTAAALEGAHARRHATLHQLFRFHSVGTHTGPNTRAFYTGTGENASATQTAWGAARRAGYLVGRVDEMCHDWGADFNGVAAPGVMDHELVAPFCLPEYHPVDPDGEPYRMFKGAFSILKRCIRGRHVHEYALDYAGEFVRRYSRKAAPFFLTATFLEGHEPSGEVVAQVDGALADLLNGLGPDVLNSTAVLVLADHGLHMGLNRMFTTNGHVEHLNPFLAMLLPPWVTERRPAAAAALADAEQRLVTPFDVWATLLHLMHLHEDAPMSGAGGVDADAEHRRRLEAWAAAANFTSVPPHAASLLAGVPAARRCEGVGIPVDLCRCE